MYPYGCGYGGVFDLDPSNGAVGDSWHIIPDVGVYLVFKFLKRFLPPSCGAEKVWSRWSLREGRGLSL